MPEERKKELSQDTEHAEEEEEKEEQPSGKVSIEQKEEEQELPRKERSEKSTEVEELDKLLSELNDKYVRLYADFENYKRLAAKNKEELIKYANEDLMRELLTVIDHLELALQHSSGNEASSSLAEGVKLTLKELKTILEKHGLVNIDAVGKPFDPYVHHAMSQIESEETDENTVVTEFRKGYMLRDRVLRAALVGVSKKASKQAQPTETKEEE